MKLILTCLCALVVTSLRAADKPNIIIFLADDLGYADIGVNGCKDIPTPNIDSIATNGVRFTDGYATQQLRSDELGRGNAIQAASVAGGVLVGGSLAMFLVEHWGWYPTMGLMALLCLLPLLALPWSDAQQARYLALAEESIAAQKAIEAADEIPFEQYRAYYVSPDRLTPGSAAGA